MKVDQPKSRTTSSDLVEMLGAYIRAETTAAKGSGGDWTDGLRAAGHLRKCLQEAPTRTPNRTLVHILSDGGTSLAFKQSGAGLGRTIGSYRLSRTPPCFIISLLPVPHFPLAIQ